MISREDTPGFIPGWLHHRWRRDRLLTPVCLGVAQRVKNRLQCGRPGFDPLVGKIPWRRDRLPTAVFWAFLVAQPVKNPPASVEDLGLIPGLGRSPGEGNPLQYSGLENSMDSIVHGVSKSHFYVSIPIQDMICLIFVQIVFQSFGKIL